jgi:hypothetical protein
MPLYPDAIGPLYLFRLFKFSLSFFIPFFCLSCGSSFFLYIPLIFYTRCRTYLFIPSFYILSFSFYIFFLFILWFVSFPLHSPNILHLHGRRSFIFSSFYYIRCNKELLSMTRYKTNSRIWIDLPWIIKHYIVYTLWIRVLLLSKMRVQSLCFRALKFVFQSRLWVFLEYHWF